MTNKNKVQDYLMDYLHKVVPNFKTEKKLFTCPRCNEVSANVFPPNSGKIHCFTPNCGKVGTIIDVTRMLEFDNCEDIPVKDIEKHLIKMFDIKTTEHVYEVFDQYVKWGWDLCPVTNANTEASGYGKASWVEEDWQLKSHKNKSEWIEWAKSINMGVKTGKMSNTLGIDFDFVESALKKKIYAGKGTLQDIELANKQHTDGLELVKKEMPYLDWSTVQQNTFGGVHLFYLYDEEVPKTAFNFKGIHIDIEAEGGQIVVEPSIVGGQKRTISGKLVKPLPKELKELIINNSGKNKKEEKVEYIAEDTELTFENLNGNRNNTFIRLYGELRKEMSIKVAYNALKKFNGLLDKKLPLKDLKAMAKQAEKYYEADIETIAEDIMEHFKMVQQDVTFRDLKEHLKTYEPIDIQKAIRFLIDKDKIYRIKKDWYKLITDVEWRTDLITVNKPLNINVPFITPHANLTNGAMIVIGGKTGTGKTITTMNFIEAFVKQNICPKLISTEATGGFGDSALSLGLKEGDFKFWQTTDPTTVPFQNNEVRIIDWLKAPNSEFFKLDTIYEELNNKLVNHGGLLIVFAQLRSKDGTFYSEDMVMQFASYVGKFLYPETNGIIDNLHPYIQSTKIRKPTGSPYVKIPLEYIPDTNRLIEK
ncbi:MAG: hypothetical protein DRN27_06215 [Thermoplasmata archaeon]|nr:MAG: hypothetical protein DRN27_06215 [Thermoplasmata archaeon]